MLVDGFQREPLEWRKIDMETLRISWNTCALSLLLVWWKGTAWDQESPAAPISIKLFSARKVCQFKKFSCLWLHLIVFLGTLGVITEVIMKVRFSPEARVYASYVFPDFELGVQFMREAALKVGYLWRSNSLFLFCICNALQLWLSLFLANSASVFEADGQQPVQNGLDFERAAQLFRRNSRQTEDACSEDHTANWWG